MSKDVIRRRGLDVDRPRYTIPQVLRFAEIMGMRKKHPEFGRVDLNDEGLNVFTITVTEKNFIYAHGLTPAEQFEIFWGGTEADKMLHNVDMLRGLLIYTDDMIKAIRDGPHFISDFIFFDELIPIFGEGDSIHFEFNYGWRRQLLLNEGFHNVIRGDFPPDPETMEGQLEYMMMEREREDKMWGPPIEVLPFKSTGQFESIQVEVTPDKFIESEYEPSPPTQWAMFKSGIYGRFWTYDARADLWLNINDLGARVKKGISKISDLIFDDEIINYLPHDDGKTFTIWFGRGKYREIFVRWAREKGILPDRGANTYFILSPDKLLE